LQIKGILGEGGEKVVQGRVKKGQRHRGTKAQREIQ